jgi:Leg1
VETRVLSPERSYADRLALLALLAEAHPYPEGSPDQRAGIVLQTKWQDRSGRALAGAGGMLDSWWPIANWTLTVWQLEALKARGEMPQVSLAARPLPLPGEVAAAICDYYDRLDAGAGHFELQRLLWRFHVLAIGHGLRAAGPRLQSLPAAEARFAESWGFCMVGLLAAVNFPTEFDTVRGMQRLLPPRLLSEADWDPAAPSDLSEAQRATAFAMRALYESERASGGAFERALAERSAAPEGARASANHLFETLAFGGRGAPELLRARLAS